MKKLRVTVDGKVYEVLVEMLDEGAPSSPSPNPIPAGRPPAVVAAHTATAAPAPVAASSGAGSVASPLAGKVVSIDVKAGQTVEEGAQLVTIEAMKMNTYVFAPKAGRVDAILVNAGDGVEEGTPLLRIV